jgi:hypothetical protein
MKRISYLSVGVDAGDFAGVSDSTQNMYRRLSAQDE